MELFNRELVRFSFHALRRNRKVQYALLASLLPLVVGIIMFFNDVATQNQPGSRFNANYTSLVASLILTGTVPFVALLLAGGMLADEVEDRTLTYLLVRPVKRRVLYASKALPVVLIAAAMGALQALLFGLCRLAAALSFGADTQVKHILDTPLPVGEVAPFTMAPILVLQVIPVAMIAAALTGAVFAALFGFVSLLTTRFHFLANLLIFVAWELPFGGLGGASSYLTITFWGKSILAAPDPTIGHLTSSDANAYFAIAWMMFWVGAWVWIGMKAIPKKSFNITSAAT